MRRLSRVSLVAPFLVAVLAGCGSATSSNADVSDSSPTSPSSSAPTSAPPSTPTPPSSSPTQGPAAGWADCTKAWKADARLPGDYQGCNDGDSPVNADRIGCSSGQKIVRYDNHYYAVLGGVIHHATDLRHDPTYIHSIQVCRG